MSDWRWGEHPAYMDEPENRCALCGREIGEDDVYCPECEKRLDEFMAETAMEFSYRFDVDLSVAKTEIEQYEFSSY